MAGTNKIPRNEKSISKCSAPFRVRSKSKKAVSFYFILIAGITAFYMAFNIGSNDSANSLASAVGAKAISLKQAVIIGGVLEFLGAYLVGSHVTNTIKKGIINYKIFPEANIFAFALFSALLGASLWVFFSTLKGLPVSTTHSIIGSLTGVGIISYGVKAIKWSKIIQIVISWITSPFFSALISFLIFTFINKFFISSENPELTTKRYFPFFIFITFFIVSLSFLFKTPLGKKLNIGLKLSIVYAFLFSTLLTFIFSLILIHSIKSFQPENIFKILQIFTSCYVAFAHGANDVANAIGPIAGIIQTYKTGMISLKTEVPTYLLALGGLGISLGIFLYGYKVIKTVGENITELTNTRGFSVDFAAATTVLLCSKLGIPVSTTHAAVGAVIGVGFARGIEAIDLRIVKKIIYAWVITLPASAILSSLIFTLIK